MESRIFLKSGKRSIVLLPANIKAGGKGAILHVVFVVKNFTEPLGG